MVECDLAKVEVAGSNPVSRSQEPRRRLPGLFNVWRRTQVVRERSAKPLCIGSNPIGASQLTGLDLPSVFSTEKLAGFSGSVAEIVGGVSFLFFRPLSFVLSS